MTNRIGLFFLLVAIAVIGALAPLPRSASADIEIRNSTAANRFPQGIQFQVFLSSTGAPITDVRLRYRILPDGVNATARPNCAQGNVSCQVTVGNTPQVYMVPGAEIVYSWEVTDEAGGRVTTPEQTIVYQDDRFQWDSITEGNLTVYFYFGDIPSQQTVMRTAQDTITKIGSILRTTVNYPVKIWVYRTAQEMSPAIASRRGQGGTGSVQTLGEVGASDTALISRDTDFLNIVRHEIAHIVTRSATRSHIVEIPVWVNEGLSVYSQSEMLPDEVAALRTAIQRNRLLPITSLGASARGAADAVSLFYAQSGSIVAFMINTYGPEKFGDFVAALAQDTTDVAMNKIYGFDQLGLENEWRKALGAAAVPGVNPTSAPQGSNQPQPTQRPNDNQSQNQNPTPRPNNNQQQASNNDDGGGISLIVVAGVLGVVVVLLLGAAGGLVYQSKRKSSGP
jgi:hypothetical protein